MMNTEQKRNSNSQNSPAANELLAAAKPNAQRQNIGFVAIWDIWTRLFHWSLAGAVIFLLVSGTTGFKFYEWHRWAGELVLTLLVFRLLWGFVGSSNVRFSALLQHPAKAVEHLRQLFNRNVKDERGHNAAGGWAILLMLLALSVQAITGLFIADEDELVEGALYGQLGSDLSDLLYRIHHLNAELLIALVGIHVAMILVYWLYASKNLISPMFSGRMRWTSHPSAPMVKFQRWWLGAACLVIAALGIAWLVG